MSVPRADRISDIVREALADVLQQETRDPRVGFVTVTDVKLSPDLKNARIYISRLGDEQELDEALTALNQAAPFFRKSLAGRTRLRFIPVLRFLRDSAVERGRRVEELLREIREEAEDVGESDSGDTGGEG